MHYVVRIIVRYRENNVIFQKIDFYFPVEIFVLWYPELKKWFLEIKQNTKLDIRNILYLLFYCTTLQTITKPV